MDKLNVDKITGVALFLVGFFLPISTAFSNIALALLLGTTLWSFIKQGMKTALLRHKNFYLFSPFLFFILVFVGFFYSPMDHDAFKEVKRNLFMLALPTLLLRKDLAFQTTLKQAAWGLVLGGLFSAISLLALNGIRVFSAGFTWYRLFSYDHTSFKFTAPLGIHPIYLGSYYLMALAFILFKTVRLKRSLAWIGALVLLTGILFLNSRIIFGLTGLMGLFFGLGNFSWKVVVPLLGVIFISGIFLYPNLKHTYLVDKLISGTKWELSENVGTLNTDHKNPADSRFSRWKIACELIWEHPLIGSGTGTERTALGVKFKENQMQVSYESRYNAHNQFIGYTIRFGFIGLAFVLVYFFGNMVVAFQQKDWNFLCFIFLIMGIGLVENYLDRNMGINFMAFFGTLFLGNLWDCPKSSK